MVEIGRDPTFCLTLFVLVTFTVASLFLILIHEPVSNWHETSFVLERTELRMVSRTGYVLYVYAVDGRRFVLNENEMEVREQLVIGEMYSAVYSEDFFHNIIQGLYDEDAEYLNLDRNRRTGLISFWVLYAAFFILGGLVLDLNGLFVYRCVNRERKRMKNFQRSRDRKQFLVRGVCPGLLFFRCKLLWILLY